MMIFLLLTIILLGGLQLICIGILGQYLDKACTEVKRRPIYIIAELAKPARQSKEQNS